MSIAQRAIAASGQPMVQEVPRDPTDRDRLREEWRLAADKYVEMDDRFQRLKEGKSIFYDELVANLIALGMKVGQAERTANTCKEHKEYLHKMHDARKAASLQRNEMEDRDRIYWAHVSKEANARREMAMR
jgi:hypothetical protein